MATASATPLAEAELHGLVDGHLEVERRADVLRRLAASPADRALVEAWQEQNDLIRAAFRDVEREALPVALDLAPPRLRCIAGDLERVVAPMCPPLRESPPPLRPRGTMAAAAMLLVVAVGLAGSWLVLGQGGRDDDMTAVAAPPATVETVLADRAASALDGAATAAGASLPAVRIPDLTAAGLRLTGVSTQAGDPASMVLRYRDAGDGRVALGIAGAQDATSTPPAAVGRTLAWRRRGAAYVLAGTLPPERLRTLAQSMQDDAGKD